LALALTGAKLRARPSWTPVDLLSYLRAGSLDTISGGSGRLQAMFDLSYQGLPPHARHLYCLLAMHPGPEITVHSAAALAGTDVAAALAGMELLQDQHLLKQPIAGRYTFHDLLRRHARQMAEADVSAEVRKGAAARLLDHCIVYSTAAVDTLYPIEQDRRLTPESPSPATPEVDFGGPDAARKWLDAEAASLIAACLSDQATEHPALCQRLAEALYRFLEVSGRHREAVAVHTAAACGAHVRGDQNGEAKALTNRAGAHWHLGDYAQAVEDNQRALELYRLSDAAPRLEGQALTNLGVAYEMLDRHDEALDCVKQALALFEAANDHASQAAALHNLASIRTHTGDSAEALAFQAQGLALARDVGDPILIAYSLSTLGSLHHKLGRRAEAREYLQSALTLADENGHQALLLICLNSLGDCIRVDDPGKALDYHHKAFAIAAEVGDRFGQAAAQERIGDSLRGLGDLQQARQHWRHALEITAAVNTRGVSELLAKLLA